MPVLSDAELWAVTESAFGDLGPQVVATQFAIQKAESGGNTEAWNPNGEDSRGLGQINVGPGANPDLARFNLWDPYQNAQAQRIVYDRQGPGAWSVYTNGMYRQYMSGLMLSGPAGGGQPTQYGDEELLGGRQPAAPAIPEQTYRQWDPRLNEQAIALAEGRMPVYQGGVAGPGPGAYDMSHWDEQAPAPAPAPALPPDEVMIPLLRQAKSIWGGQLPEPIAALFPGV